LNTPDESLSFPISRVQPSEDALSAAERTALIQQIADLPAQLTAVADISTRA
jgi:hypothetical protein